jgi:hypothetical protein
VAFETYVYMVSSAPSLPTAVAAILNRVYPLGERMEGSFCELMGEGRTVPEAPDWATKVNAWPGVNFSIFKPGPLIPNKFTGTVIGVSLKKLSGTMVRTTVDVSGRMLRRLFLDGRQHDPIFYAPLFQIALAMNARAGVGDLELDEFDPKSEKEVEAAIRSSPQEPGEPSRFGFLKKVQGTPKPDGEFIVTERPEGYWLLEHPSFRSYLGEK